jgi:hypothetical protein
MKSTLIAIMFVLYSASAVTQTGSFQDTLNLALQGNLEAQHNIGVMYAEGLGIAQNNILALQWYRRAAEQGFSPSQDALGFMYDNGKGVAEDDQEAFKWYRLAAQQGRAESQHNLGNIYANGEGVAQDDQEALNWYRLAANQGYWQSQYNLGLIYARGKGVPIDHKTAYMWFSVSVENGGDAETQRNREVASSFLSPQEIERAKVMTTECIEKKVCDSSTVPPPSNEALERASGIVSTLQELNELFESGVLTEEEFQAAKRRVLGLD